MLSTESAISEVPLNTKERNALALLGVVTVNDFLHVDLLKIFGLRGFHATTYARLKKSRDTLRAMLFRHSFDGNAAPGLQRVDEVATLALTARGVEALRQLKVNTVQDFLLLDLEAVGRLPNCGACTRRNLAEVQATLRARSGRGLSKRASETSMVSTQPRQDDDMLEFVMQPATLYSWKKLPLFSGRPLLGITSADLHDSYHPDASLERLTLPGRIKRAIAEKGITCVGDLLLTPGRQLIQHHGLGYGALSGAQSLIDSFLKRSLTGTARMELDTGSPDGFLASLLKPAIGNERQRHVLLERMGWRSPPRTLKEVARELGLTKERIRQIEQKGLRQLLDWQAAEALEPLHELILGMLRDLTPVISLRGICKALQVLYGWEKPLHEEALSRFLPVFSDLKCVEERHVCLRRFRCIDCPSLPSALDSALADAPEKKTSLSHMARRLRAQMLKAEDCQRCGECPERSSVSLLRIAFARSATAPKQFRLVKGELWSRDHWRITKGPISTLLESILRGHRGPMSYREVHAAVLQIRQDKVTPEMVRHALGASVHQGTDILLWDRRGLYQHKSHVNLYTPILNKIEKWIVQALRDGPFPQLSANAAFQAFTDECMAAGLTSEYAIHSCLKHRQHPKLVFFKTPYIGLAGASGYRIPNLEIVEELIRQEGDVVEYEALRQTVCERMGLKEFQFLQIVNQWEDVIRTEKGFLHADYFDAESPGFRALVAHVAQRVDREGELSAQLAYSEKTVSCLQLRIDGPRMLYYLLELYAADQVRTGGYPTLLRKSGQENAEVRGIRERVARFI